ncbi:hypothetical protein PGTUg99_005846 [Puccinia graminis f. sp. tritici]|uniref:Uncharacterized protein n=1 Tax=Puccinia graminis f. sp. tritici TaxID=56615 RepID=A0A5B0RDB6_PUCGR|nr:hypothetical protein PGTUg99_005846 [Puccinia graminis f. sp. tritici]
MLPTQNQLRPEITKLNLDTSPPHHRRVIVWSPLTIGIFPLIVSGSPINAEANLDLLEKQTLTPPQEGNLILSTEWTPTAAF